MDKQNCSSGEECRGEGYYQSFDGLKASNYPTEKILKSFPNALKKYAYVAFGLGCCVFGFGWIVALASIGHRTLLPFLVGAILCFCGAVLFIWAFELLTALDRRSENGLVHPIIIAELKLGD
jgi:hypothetical protein